MMFMTLAYAAVIVGAAIEGQAASPAGWIWPGCLATLLVVSGYRGGR
jgi:hypothetical protein